ncbi:MAG: beta-lactamase domain protein [Nocardioides sp.]|jgi:glyoxylase-like metal-dependent hydrolase (beta-lactamase superfamily II)|nr:beta-lactamase domain protein [Nocardioides sp.]
MVFTEVADRIWVARYDWFDVNVTLIGGGRGLLAVDTNASGAAARAVVDDVRRLGMGAVVGVVNTHEHFDHTFGNAEFRSAYGTVPIHAHETAAERTVSAGERIKGRYAAPPPGEDPDEHAPDVLATEIVAADNTFSSAVSLDLGDRAVELVHPGRGHTAGDLVVRVPDADVLLAGDLVEESAPPGFGGDCYPLEWPWSLDIVLGLSTSGTVVVPGHGVPVDRDFVEEQRNSIGLVAEAIRELAGRGVPLDQALAAGEWPYPQQALTHAVRRGYEQLPRGHRQLPLA